MFEMLKGHVTNFLQKVNRTIKIFEAQVAS